MTDWLKYAAILVVTLWAISHFGRMVWVGLLTGRLINSHPSDGVPVTRTSKPIAFWFSMTLALLILPAFVWLAVNLSAHLLGLWEFSF
jgi:hypothetical protein